MRLFFDLQPLIQSSQYGISGIARWTLGSVNALARLEPDWDLEGFAILDSSKQGESSRPRRLESGRRLVPLWGGPISLVPSKDGVEVAWPEQAPDAVLGSSFLTPSGGSPEIPVVHDLAFIKFPETQPEPTLALLRDLLPDNLRRASVIVTVSEAMKSEIVEHFGVRPEIVEVIYPGCEHARSKDSLDLCSAALPEAIPDRFYLVVGTLEPRKNLQRILVAHRALRKARPGTPRIVLAGATGWREEGFAEVLRQQISSGDAIWAGYVSQSSLVALYRHAEALVFPSLYEGFGLPVIEAMAAGCPVITSAVSGTAEAAGNAAILVDPFDIDAIMDGMQRILEDDARQSLIALGRTRAEEFSWERTGRRLRDTVCSVVAGAGAVQQQAPA